MGGEFTRVHDEVGLSQAELWMRYLGLGGHAWPTEFDAYLTGALELPGVEHDYLVQALNERSMELGSPRRWPYAEDLP